jgi:hypothetical protein
MNCIQKLTLASLCLLALTACGRLGLAPADLDMTPSPVPPTEVASTEMATTPSPTAGDTTSAPAPETSPLDRQLAALRTEIPNELPAGGVIWRRSNDSASGQAETPLPNVTNGMGFKVYYTEQIGGKANLSYAVFDTPEDAAAHYERIKGIRSVLATGQSNATLPQPNLLGSGLYGSVGILQIENVFVEVSIEVFSSTSGNPLFPLSKAAVEIAQRALLRAATPETKTARLEALLASLPLELNAAGLTWTRDSRAPLPSDTLLANGRTFITRYTAPDGQTATLTIGTFDKAADRNTAYESLVRKTRNFDLRYSLALSDTLTDLAGVNSYKVDTLMAESLVAQVGENYLFEIELVGLNTEGLLSPFAVAVAEFIQNGADTFNPE